jgi:hypothetical protein
MCGTCLGGYATHQHADPYALENIFPFRTVHRWSNNGGRENTPESARASKHCNDSRMAKNAEVGFVILANVVGQQASSD